MCFIFEATPKALDTVVDTLLNFYHGVTLNKYNHTLTKGVGGGLPYTFEPWVSRS